MGKYEPLGQFLRKQSRDHLPMTFTEIEKILGTALPPSKQHRAWWSNNPSNNVMTREWLEAGYETEAVDVDEGKLVFRKKYAPANETALAGRAPIFGCLKGLLTVADGYDPASPLDLEAGWDAKYLKADGGR